LLVSVLIYARQQETPVSFPDITSQAGIVFKHENGPTPQKYMPETMAGLSIMLDYNNDGWPDLYVASYGATSSFTPDCPFFLIQEKQFSAGQAYCDTSRDRIVRRH
jgi:hypothetical protein